jgi:hypothetical protein
MSVRTISIQKIGRNGMGLIADLIPSSANLNYATQTNQHHAAYEEGFVAQAVYGTDRADG